MSLEKLQVKIGGMACSFCVETIKKGLGRMEGVSEVNVSLAHEEALVVYDPERVRPGTRTNALRSLGYTVRDPKKISTFGGHPARRRSAGRSDQVPWPEAPGSL
jgi:copper chaperone CopZ